VAGPYVAESHLGCGLIGGSRPVRRIFPSSRHTQQLVESRGPHRCRTRSSRPTTQSEVQSGSSDRRDLCELLGIARGLLADGSIKVEAVLLRDWVGRHQVRTIHDRLIRHFRDGVIDEAVRTDLKRLLDQLVSGELSAVSDTDAATTLPLEPAASRDRVEWDDVRSRVSSPLGLVAIANERSRNGAECAQEILRSAPPSWSLEPLEAGIGCTRRLDEKSRRQCPIATRACPYASSPKTIGPVRCESSRQYRRPVLSGNAD
jgi:hypothetical protein